MSLPAAATYTQLLQRAVKAAEEAASYQMSTERANIHAKLAEVYARLAHTAADRELRNAGR